MTPREEDAPDRVAQIHRAALALFSHNGYHETSMDDIVAQSGLSKGTLYWYFHSKRDLFRSLLRHTVDCRVRHWRDRVAACGDSAIEQVLASLDYFRDNASEMSTLSGVMIEGWELARNDAEMRQTYADALAPAHQMLHTIVQHGLSTGEFRLRCSEASPFVLMSLIVGLVFRMGSHIWEHDWDSIIDCVQEILLHGLGVEDASHA